MAVIQVSQITQSICTDGRAGSAPGAPTRASSSSARAASVPDTFPAPSPSAFPAKHRSAFHLQEACFPWQRHSRGIWGSLPPSGSPREAGPGCRAGDELRGRGESPAWLQGQPQPREKVGEEGEPSPKGMKDARRRLSQWRGWIWLSWLRLGGSAGRGGVQSPPILCRGSGQTGSRGRTNSQPWGWFILLGYPWQSLFKCFPR